ncbi:NAD(P)/FAD-dependent oxidoreductase [Psychrobacter sp. M13]|uniref:NAD(P)/FAD-dependent oxidoreductase n=1 Tax=Psychrobacter sp. M13 TaxID=3067275 RepID=UPI00273AEEBA|nr:NAD(P)-binding protein [Psychrobacter sp. M13]WLP94776.1 NAD(P)-binding protein [Psychrobacter sp. M13]
MIANHSARASHNVKTVKIAIIGGGLTGLMTATLLERALAKQPNQADVTSNNKADITIFEKSRSVGRLATRYRTNKDTDANTNTDHEVNKQWQWAFGAQFFTAKTDGFSQFIAPWLDSGLLQPWCAQVVELLPASDDNQPPTIDKNEQWDSTHARFVSTPKMTSWGRALADNLASSTVKFKTRVAPLNDQQYNSTTKKTELFDEDGASLGQFDWVICTAPNGQAIELMADSGFSEQAKILKPEMLACYTLMLGWDNLESLPESLNAKSLDDKSSSAWDVAYVQESILDRIFVEHHKPNHEHILPSVTIHADNEWSQQQVDEDIEEMTRQLLAEAKQALNWNDDTAPSQVDCHRWRFASTLMPLDIEGDEKPLGLLIDKKNQWIVSGDWCGQGNIESCYQMAVETVVVVTGVLGK